MSEDKKKKDPGKDQEKKKGASKTTKTKKPPESKPKKKAAAKKPTSASKPKKKAIAAKKAKSAAAPPSDVPEVKEFNPQDASEATETGGSENKKDEKKSMSPAKIMACWVLGAIALIGVCALILLSGPSPASLSPNTAEGNKPAASAPAEQPAEEDLTIAQSCSELMAKCDPVSMEQKDSEGNPAPTCYPGEPAEMTEDQAKVLVALDDQGCLAELLGCDELESMLCTPSDKCFGGEGDANESREWALAKLSRSNCMGRDPQASENL